jgi:hypothetical protein
MVPSLQTKTCWASCLPLFVGRTHCSEESEDKVMENRDHAYGRFPKPRLNYLA